MDEEKKRKMTKILNEIGRLAYGALNSGEDFVILYTGVNKYLGLMNIKDDSPNFNSLIQGEQGQINDLISHYQNVIKNKVVENSVAEIKNSKKDDGVTAELVKNEVDGTVLISFK